MQRGWSPLLATCLFAAACLAARQDFQEFKRMPDNRGQSFGLENFLLQPFNLATQTEVKRRYPVDPSYSLEYQVQNDGFDMRKIVPTLPGASLVFDQQPDVRPVHEFPEHIPHSMMPRRRQTEGNKQYIVQDSRRPLDKPSEFMLSITEHEAETPSPTVFEEPPPERPRKRVMKRRRKKPSTPAPELDEPNFEKGFLPNVPNGIASESKESKVRVEFNGGRRQRPAHNKVHEEVEDPEEQRPTDEPEESEGPVDGRRQRPKQPVEEEQEPTENRRHRPNHNKPPPSAPEESETPHDGRRQRLPSHNKPPPSAPEEAEPPQDGRRQRLPIHSKPPPSAPEEAEPPHDGRRQRLPIHSKPPPSAPEETEPAHDGRRQRLPSHNKLPPIADEPEIPLRRQRLPTHQIPPTEEETERPVLEREQIDVDEITFTTMPPPTQKLKNLLKQQNGQLSLSELLQTQNLSLSDLLKGNPGALSALGANKITDNNKSKEVKPYIPKISNRSRPFMKPLNNTRNSPTTEETISPTSQELPKKLQIIEVTTERYNGFTPKKPRIRQKFENGKVKESSESPEEQRKEIFSNEIKPTDMEAIIDEILNNEKLEASSSTTTTTTTTTTNQPIVKDGAAPKRSYSEYRNKQRIDRRRSSTESSSTSELTTIPLSSTTEQIKTTKDSRNRVRIPFMSVNNPEISVIVPNKKTTTTTTTTTTSTERTSPVIKDRIHLFKKINSEENILDVKELESFASSTPAIQTTTPEVMNDTSDELLELLKTGNNEARLQRILDSRNMTIGELVEKRANSSRQPNVTNLFKISQPKIPVTPTPTTSTQPKKPHSDPKGIDQLFVEESMISPVTLSFDKKDENRESKAYETKTVGTVHRVPLNHSPGEGKAKAPVPLWKVEVNHNINPFPSYEMNKNLAGVRTTTETSKEDLDDVFLDTIPKNVDSNTRLKSNINDILKEVEKVDVNDSEKDKHSGFIPPAVKSAVIASAVVLGIALLLFVAIFAACGWKQRQFRLRARSSILNDSLNGSPRKVTRRTGTLSPVSFKRSSLYKKSIDFDTESSVSGSSNTSSYLWNTLKHTFQSRNSTLKNRQEKEEKIQERENRSRRNTLVREDERGERSRRNTVTMSPEEMRREDMPRREGDMPRREGDIPRRAETMLRDGTRGSYHQQHGDSRRFNSLLRDNERCSFKKIDPDRNIIQTSVNFKRGGFNGSSRHFDSTCQHFN